MGDRDFFAYLFAILMFSASSCYVGCEAGKQIGVTAQKNGRVVWATNSVTNVTFKIKE